MTRISIELVPRSIESLHADLNALHTHFPEFDTVNIPDLLRFDVRSWDACALAQSYCQHTIPHIRAMDFSRDEPFPLLDFIDRHDFRELLIVTGDPPPNGEIRPDASTPVELLRQVREARPHIKLYAAIDPYRNGIQNELEYARAKQEAGAEAFFTQPFFDVRLMDIFHDQTPDLNIYWGISPVLGARSQRYWVKRNRAVFPSSFEPTLEWNWRFGKRALEFARETEGNLYFMPIRADVTEYLQGIFKPELAAVQA